MQLNIFYNIHMHLIVKIADSIILSCANFEAGSKGDLH